MDEAQRAMISKLSYCSFGVGTWDKRFVRDLNSQIMADPEKELTPLQDWALRGCYYRYRKQLGQPSMPKPADYDAPPVVEKVKQPDGSVIVCVRPSVSATMAADRERLKRWNEGKPQ